MRPKHLTVGIFSIGHILTVGVTWAHHSISADFNPGESITIKGVVTEFRFVNPHPYATMDDVGAESEEWTLLLDDRWELVEAGFSRSTFQPGDELIVSGEPSLRDTNSLYVRSIERPSDGFVYLEDAGEDDD